MFTLIIEDKHGGIADEYSFEDGEFYIGRSHTSDIILPSDNVSRRHARLYTVDEHCYIEDLNSSNGVFVNGRRIHEVYQIVRSAQIKVGDYYLHIESDTAVEAVDEDTTYVRLCGKNLAFTNQVFKVQRKVTLIGRGKDCTVTVIDPSVSRIHTKLTVERSGALTLEDLKSSNGTFINDERIEVGSLNHGDLVRFGNVEFSVEIPGEAPVSAPASSPPSRQIRRKTGSGVRHEVSSPAARPYEDWGAPPTAANNNKIWLIASVFFGVVLLTGIILLLFKDDIFGDDAVAKPGGGDKETSAEVAGTNSEGSEEQLKTLVATGNERVKKRQWDLALETWSRVRDIDPLHPGAQRNINLVKKWRGHKQAIDKARQFHQDLKRGEAALLLRGVDDASVYFEEASTLLAGLKRETSTLRLSADNDIKQKKCEAAIAKLRELVAIDPTDTLSAAKLTAQEKKRGTWECIDSK